MAKKMKPGQKRCPSCGAMVKGPRTKTCPKCGHGFNGKPQEAAKNGGTVTLDRTQVNKSQAVRDYLKDHPKAMNNEIATALSKQGIKMTPDHIAAIKSQGSTRPAPRKRR